MMLFVRMRGVAGAAAAIGCLTVVGGLQGCGLDLAGSFVPELDAGAGDVVVDAPRPRLDASDGASSVDAAADAPSDVVVIDAPSDAGREVDCLDGIDNDGDGMTDCGDPDCQALVRCVPAAFPAGFTSYGTYADARATACPAGYGTTADTFENPTSPSASCTACSCDTPALACSTVLTVSCDNSNACDGGTARSASVTANGSCVSSGLPSGLDVDNTWTCKLTTPTPTGTGSCTPSGGQPNGAAAQFNKQSRTCGLTSSGLGCPGGNICVPRVPGGFKGLCVRRAIGSGPAAVCPAGFTHQHLTAPTATSFLDGRTCSACTCDPPQGVSCSASTILYGSNDCSTGGLNPLPSDDTCHALTSSTTATTVSSAKTTLTVGGSCPKKGGVGSGTVNPINVVEHCCEN